uniref:Sulfotransferase n=1 Tax=Sphaeramia orbicularis TaxID=375764 RepID=A0A673BGR4_9TELE
MSFVVDNFLFFFLYKVVKLSPNKNSKMKPRESKTRRLMVTKGNQLNPCPSPSLSPQLVEQAPSPRFLGTHMHPDNIPQSFYQNKTKMLVIFRNPKDTLVSYYHFCNNNPVLPSMKSWESFFTDFLSGDVPWGSYFDHALAWEKKMDDPSVMVVTYEELKQNLSQGVRQISKFFGFSLTEAQVQEVANGSTFSAMKESSTHSHGNMGNVIFRKGAADSFHHVFFLHVLLWKLNVLLPDPL